MNEGAVHVVVFPVSLLLVSADQEEDRLCITISGEDRTQAGLKISICHTVT